MGWRRATVAGAVAALALLPSGARGQDAPPGGAVIYRDAHGTPHVEAADSPGLAYGTGYALAQDRPFMTVAVRLLAQGRSAELLGPDALPADRAMRRDFHDAADVRRQYEELAPGRKAELQAYADGLNRGMAEVMADPLRRPIAFDVLGHRPEPWTPTDSMAVVGMFTWANFAGEGGGGQLGNAELLGRLVERFGERRGLRIWDDLTFKNDPAAPTVARRGEGRKAPAAIRRERWPGKAQRELAVAQADAARRARTRRARELTVVQRILRRLPVPKMGSYAAVIGGSRTASGGAIVLGAPQSGLNAPPVFWQVGQHLPDRHCTGFTVPGLGPWLGIGWCGGHAWTLVAGNLGEQVDHYVERLHPDDPRRYWHDGAWREMRVRRERIRANPCIPPVCAGPSLGSTETMVVEETVHGPVVARDERRGVAITQRRAQRGIWARGIEAFAGWNTARSLEEFDRATSLAPASYNVFYGDDRGRVLYRFSGLQPVRAPGIDRRLPSPGTGEAEWRGMLPARQMPRVADPPSGLLVSNQGVETKPASWWPNASGVGVGQVTRVGWNRRLLGRTGLDVAEVERINPLLLERRDGITPVLAGHLRSVLAGSPDPRLREALALLEEWVAAGFPREDADGDGFYDHPAVMIFGADHFNLPSSQYPRYLWSALLDRMFADELGAPAGGGERGTFQLPGNGFQRLSLLKLALDGRKASRRLSRDMADDLRTPQREKAVDHVRASVTDALEQLERRFGTPEMRRWLGPVPTMRFEPLGLVEPPPIRGFDHGTYSQIVDPRAGVGRYVLAPGNAGADGAPAIVASQLGSFPAHFDDQRELYEDYGFLDMLHTRDEYGRAPESVTVVAP